MADDVSSMLAKVNASDADAISGLQGQIKNNTPQGIFANLNPLYLAAAQGFLSPTKTGGFGESVGNAAAQVSSPLAAMKQNQMTALEKIAAIQKANAELNMQAPLIAARTAHYNAMGGSGGVGTPYSQMSALNTELKALQSMTDEDAIDQNIDKNKEIGSILARMAAVREAMSHIVGGGTGAGAGTGSSTDASGLPVIKNEQDLAKFPGGRFIYNGKIYTKPIPDSTPRG